MPDDAPDDGSLGDDASDEELDLVPCWPCRARRRFSEHAPDELAAHLLATHDELERLDAFYCTVQAAADQYAAAHRN